MNCKEIRSTINRPLFEDGLDIIISMNTLVSILNKVKDYPDFVSMMTVTQGRNAFGIVGKQSELNRLTQEKPFNNSNVIFQKLLIYYFPCSQFLII